jgi:hypothetical protein
MQLSISVISSNRNELFSSTLVPMLKRLAHAAPARRSISGIAVCVALLAVPVPAVAASSVHREPPPGPARRAYNTGRLECNIDRSDYGWSLSRAERSLRSEYRRSALPFAIDGCIVAYHGR